MKAIILSLTFGTLGCLLTSSVLADSHNWPNWRGPSFNGSSGEKNLPAKFSKTENVKWSAEMPGPSAATAVIWNDRVFVNSTHSENKALQALCLDRATGRILWQQEVAPGFRQDDRSNYASPSPVTDGEIVVFFYGTGDLAAFDFSGKKLWARNLQKDYGQFAFLWTFSSSPLLHDGRLYMQVLQRDVVVNGRGRKDGPNDSYLLALDPKTGEQLWRVVRPSEAREESREAFSTPIPFTHNGRAEVLVVGSDCITGHNPVNGRELWRWGTWNPTRITHWRLVPSPVTGGGVVLACGPKEAPIYALKAGGKGILPDSAIAWESQGDVTSDVPTPLFYKDRFYVLNGKKRKLFCLEPATGRVVWSGDLDTRSVFEASPTAGDDKIYCMSHNGDTFVVQAGDHFKLLHSANMGDEADRSLRSSIAIAQGNLFLRAGGRLYCLGN